MNALSLYVLYSLVIVSSIAEIILSAVLKSKYADFKSYIQLLPNLMNISGGLGVSFLTCGIVLSAILLCVILTSLGLFIY